MVSAALGDPARSMRVIHHGGNNSFTECLYFGKPAIIMPYVWDGHDNATRVQETGHGFKLDRYNWTEEELQQKIMTMLTDKKMKAQAQEDVEEDAGAARADQGRQDHRQACAQSTPHDRREIRLLRTLSARSGALCRSAQGLGSSAEPDRRQFEERWRAAAQGAGRAAGSGPVAMHAGHLALVDPARRALPFRVGPGDLQASNRARRSKSCRARSILFPAGWTGTCTVHETMRNVYMLS